jgi:uncharacterized cupin superfamily protein
VRSGDIIVCPPGDAEKAHQRINTSASELRYLSISSMDLPEIAEYPDSTRLGVYSVSAAISFNRSMTFLSIIAAA